MAALTLNLPGSSVSDGSGLYNTALQAGLASSELLNNAFNTFNKVGQRIGDKNVAEAWVQAIAAGKSPDEALALASKAGNSFTSAEALNTLYTQNLSQRIENRAAAKEERDLKDWQDTIAAAKFNRANEIAISNLDRKAYQANADAVLAADPGIQRYVTLGNMTSAVDKHQLSQADTNFKNTSASVAAAKEAREAEDWKNTIAAAPYVNEIQAAVSLLNQGEFEKALNIINKLPAGIQSKIPIPNFMDAKDKSLQAQAEARYRNISADNAAAEEARKVEDREHKRAAAPYNKEMAISTSLLDKDRYKKVSDVIGTLPPEILEFIDITNFSKAESELLESKAKVNASNANALKIQQDLQEKTIANFFNARKALTDDDMRALEETAQAFGMTTQDVQTLIGGTETGQKINKVVLENTLEQMANNNFTNKGSPKDFRKLDQDTVVKVVAGTNPNPVNEHQQKAIQAANDAETNRLLDMFSWLSKESATKLINSKSKEELEANKKELKQNLQTKQVMAGGPNAHSGYSSFYNDLDKLEFDPELKRVGTKDTKNNIIKNYENNYNSGINKGDSSIRDIFNNKKQAEFVDYYINLSEEYKYLKKKKIREGLTQKEQARFDEVLPLLRKHKGEFDTNIQGLLNGTEYLANMHDLVNKLEGVDSISFESLGKFLEVDTFKEADSKKFAKAVNATMQEVADKLKEQHVDGINTNLHINDRAIKIALAMLIKENPEAVSDPQEWLSARFKDFSAEDIIDRANIINVAILDGTLAEAAKTRKQVERMSSSVDKVPEFNIKGN